MNRKPLLQLFEAKKVPVGTVKLVAPKSGMPKTQWWVKFTESPAIKKQWKYWKMITDPLAAGLKEGDVINVAADGTVLGKFPEPAKSPDTLKPIPPLSAEEAAAVSTAVSQFMVDHEAVKLVIARLKQGPASQDALAQLLVNEFGDADDAEFAQWKSVLFALLKGGLAAPMSDGKLEIADAHAVTFGLKPKTPAEPKPDESSSKWNKTEPKELALGHPTDAHAQKLDTLTLNKPAHEGVWTLMRILVGAGAQGLTPDDLIAAAKFHGLTWDQYTNAVDALVDAEIFGITGKSKLALKPEWQSDPELDFVKKEFLDFDENWDEAQPSEDYDKLTLPVTTLQDETIKAVPGLTGLEKALLGALTAHANYIKLHQQPIHLSNVISSLKSSGPSISKEHVVSVFKAALALGWISADGGYVTWGTELEFDDGFVHPTPDPEWDAIPSADSISVADIPDGMAAELDEIQLDYDFKTRVWTLLKLVTAAPDGISSDDLKAAWKYLAVNDEGYSHQDFNAALDFVQQHEFVGREHGKFKLEPKWTTSEEPEEAPDEPILPGSPVAKALTKAVAAWTSSTTMNSALALSQHQDANEALAKDFGKNWLNHFIDITGFKADSLIGHWGIGAIPDSLVTSVNSECYSMGCSPAQATTKADFAAVNDYLKGKYGDDWFAQYRVATGTDGTVYPKPSPSKAQDPFDYGDWAAIPETLDVDEASFTAAETKLLKGKLEKAAAHQGWGMTVAGDAFDTFSFLKKVYPEGLPIKTLAAVAKYSVSSQEDFDKEIATLIAASMLDTKDGKLVISPATWKEMQDANAEPVIAAPAPEEPPAPLAWSSDPMSLAKAVGVGLGDDSGKAMVHLALAGGDKITAANTLALAYLTTMPAATAIALVDKMADLAKQKGLPISGLWPDPTPPATLGTWLNSSGYMDAAPQYQQELLKNPDFAGYILKNYGAKWLAALEAGNTDAIFAKPSKAAPAPVSFTTITPKEKLNKKYLSGPEMAALEKAHSLYKQATLPFAVELLWVVKGNGSVDRNTLIAHLKSKWPTIPEKEFNDAVNLAANSGMIAFENPGTNTIFKWKGVVAQPSAPVWTVAPVDDPNVEKLLGAYNAAHHQNWSTSGRVGLIFRHLLAQSMTQDELQASVDKNWPSLGGSEFPHIVKEVIGHGWIAIDSMDGDKLALTGKAQMALVAEPAPKPAPVPAPETKEPGGMTLAPPGDATVNWLCGAVSTKPDMAGGILLRWLVGQPNGILAADIPTVAGQNAYKAFHFQNFIHKLTNTGWLTSVPGGWKLNGAKLAVEGVPNADKFKAAPPPASITSVPAPSKPKLPAKPVRHPAANPVLAIAVTTLMKQMGMDLAALQNDPVLSANLASMYWSDWPAQYAAHAAALVAFVDNTGYDQILASPDLMKAVQDAFGKEWATVYNLTKSAPAKSAPAKKTKPLTVTPGTPTSEDHPEMKAALSAAGFTNDPDKADALGILHSYGPGGAPNWQITKDLTALGYDAAEANELYGALIQSGLVASAPNVNIALAKIDDAPVGTPDALEHYMAQSLYPLDGSLKKPTEEIINYLLTYGASAAKEVAAETNIPQLDVASILIDLCSKGWAKITSQGFTMLPLTVAKPSGEPAPITLADADHPLVTSLVAQAMATMPGTDGPAKEPLLKLIIRALVAAGPGGLHLNDGVKKLLYWATTENQDDGHHTAPIHYALQEIGVLAADTAVGGSWIWKLKPHVFTATTTVAAKPATPAVSVPLASADDKAVKKVLAKLGLDDPETPMAQIVRALVASAAWMTNAKFDTLMKDLGAHPGDVNQVMTGLEALGHVKKYYTGVKFHFSKALKGAEKSAPVTVAPTAPPVAPSTPVAPTTTTTTTTTMASIVPDPKSLKYFKSGADYGMAGAGEKHVYVAGDGKKWLFKVAKTKNGGKVKPLAAAAQEMFARVALKAKPFHLPIGAVTIDGKLGTLQPLLDTNGNLAGPLSPTKLSGMEMTDVAAEHILDWVMSQHDGHGANLLRLPNGRVVGVDKEQGFRFFPDDKLSVTYHPNTEEHEPYYNPFWKAFAANSITFDPTTLLPTIQAIEAISDDEYRQILHPYAAERSKSVADQNDFKDLALERKKNVRKDFEKFITDLFRQRTGKGKDWVFTFDQGWTTAAAVVQKPAAPAPAPTGPKTLTSMSLYDAAAVIGIDSGSLYYSALKALATTSDVQKAIDALTVAAPSAAAMHAKRVHYVAGKLAAAGIALTPPEPGSTTVWVGKKPDLSMFAANKPVPTNGAVGVLNPVIVEPPSSGGVPKAPKPPTPAGYPEPPAGKMWEITTGDKKVAQYFYKLKDPKTPSGETDPSSPNGVLKLKGCTVEEAKEFLEKLGVAPLQGLPGKPLFNYKDDHVLVIVDRQDWEKAKANAYTVQWAKVIDIPPPPAPPGQADKFKPIPQAGELKNLPVPGPNVEELATFHADKDIGFGKVFFIGGAAVERMSVCATRMIDPKGKTFYRFAFKLREHVRQKVASSGQVNFQYTQTKYDPAQDAWIDSGHGAQSGVVGGCAKWTVGDSTLHLATGSAVQSYKGLAIADVYPDATGGGIDKKLAQLLNTAQWGLAAEVLKNPTQTEQDVFKLTALLWARAPKQADKLTMSERNVTTLKQKLTALGYTEADFSNLGFEIAGMAQVVPVLKGRGKKLAAEHNLSCIVHGCSTPEKVVSQLFSGALSIAEKQHIGVGAGTTSVSSDQNSGGADQVFTNVCPKDGYKYIQSGWPHNSWGEIWMTFDLSELDRLDVFQHSTDAYGITNGSSWYSRQSLEDSTPTEMQEVLFRKGISSRKLLRVICSSAQQRVDILQYAKQKGITKVNGMLLEDLVVVRGNQNFYKNQLAPAGY